MRTGSLDERQSDAAVRSDCGHDSTGEYEYEYE